MVAIKHITLPLMMVALSSFNSRAEPAVSNSAENPDASLFAQSAAAALSHDFPSRDISFLVLDTHAGRLLASRWEQPDTPIPMGSLVKPLTALAYGEQHEFRYPVHTCRGTATGCWLPRGHGDVDLKAAIAYSCNSYFRMLTANLSAANVSPTATRFGIEPPGPELAGPELAGLGTSWRISPLQMARAYLELSRERERAGVGQIIAGMAESGLRGTGAEVHRALSFPNALVKTGTAACIHSPHARGDGFTIALIPADQPRVLLLVRVHGVPGAQAAKIAGQMLRRIEE